MKFNSESRPVLANLMAQPKEGGEVRNVVGMKMAYGDQRQVAKFCRPKRRKAPPPMSTSILA